MVTSVTFGQLSQLFQGSWKPAPGHYHSPEVWAMWDGSSATWGLQPGVTQLSPESAAIDGDFAAFLARLELPTAAEIAARGMAAFGRWLAAGLPLVDETTRQKRAMVCEACPAWDSEARAGLGRCGHPKCGCTSLKWWLKTEKCPAGWWPA
ncbi:hypothetical protein [Prosthecobacter vanneervenii]|uniref:Uncharacterized protein n=1 Tax=Prosthecobacter vanneervenii TaxID=48466 RepID=A0A7W7YC73_9BACT|nr:hypothetical protein [Prosthecobacter vanneervenii]MBB5033180.1 hypothetical protein [Prosthecobacter vanneervenii]